MVRTFFERHKHGQNARRNKTLLNVIEPSLENPSLEVLLGILQRRIELDKECLFQFNQLKKDRRLLMTSSRNPSVAPVIMRFQKGCQQVGRRSGRPFCERPTLPEIALAI